MQQRVVIGALVAALLLGGGIIYWFVFASGPRTKQVKVDPKSPGALVGRGGMTRMPQLPPAAIEKTDDNNWIVRGNTGGMRVQRGATGKFKFNYFFASFRPPPEALALWSAQRRALHDQAMAKEWEITPDQLKQLKALKLDGSPAPKPSPADQQAVEGLWASYVSTTDGASRMDLQKKIVEKLDESAKSSVDAARQSVSDHADKLKQILTPDQVTKMTKPG